MAANPNWTYNNNWTVQDFLNAGGTQANSGQRIWTNPDKTQDIGMQGYLTTANQLYGGQTPQQYLQSAFGISDPMNNLGARVPDALPGSLMPEGQDLAGMMLALAPMAAMVGGAAGVGGLSNMPGTGLSGMFGGVGTGAEAGGLAPWGAGESVSGFYGPTAGELGGAASSYSGQGLGSFLNAGGGEGGEGLAQLASDAGDEVVWNSQGFQPTPVDDAGGGGFWGGLGSFLGGIKPDTWLNLGGRLLQTGAGLYAQNQASSAQQAAARDAQALQAAMFAQNRADLAPWREAGVGALGQINQQMPEFTRRFGMSDYQQDPGYQFRLAEGEKAINRAAQARGLFDSGATMKALDKYNSNMASQEFGNAYNRFTQDQTNAYNKLSNLAGMGQTTAQQVANLGGQYANNAGELGMQGANARASGYVGMANTTANAINQGLTTYQQQQMLPYLRSYFGP